MKTTIKIAVIAMMGMSLGINAQQFEENANELKTTKEIISPVIWIGNELRVANTFVPSNPAIGTLDNSGYGINIHKTNGIGFAFNGVHKTIIKPSGEIISPVMLLDNELRVANTFVTSDPAIGTLDNSGYGINIHKTNGIGFAFNGTHKILFRPNGNTAIKGKLEATEIKVTTSPTADFVFEADYDLPTLKSIEKHIKEKKHLPEIASAKEMEKNGVNVGDFQIQLLQKIEELTLYTIEQEKKLVIQQKEIEELKKQNSKVEEQEKKIERLEFLVQKLLKDRN
ncbi:hypothetical protein [Tenacibaculum sp. nBUS_03]|uniref:hypothetical protein n=1 Tax=Tenacibaculum sp. nBUS_03 TaxID=3395320 RepID=UPI003EBFEF9E